MVGDVKMFDNPRAEFSIRLITSNAEHRIHLNSVNNHQVRATKSEIKEKLIKITLK